MRVRLMAVFGSLLIAAVPAGIAHAQDAQAPPMLTPEVAADVAVACPAAQTFANALVRGVTLAQASAALPVLTDCANAIRLPELRWKNSVAAVGLAAAQLSAGILSHDSALLKSAAAATRYLREQSAASDTDVLAWDQIPDAFDVGSRRGVVFAGQSCSGEIFENAAYLNVAASSGRAWIAKPRAVPARCEGGAIRAVARVGVPAYPQRPPDPIDTLDQGGSASPP